MALEIKVLKQVHLLLTDEERQIKKSRTICNSVLTIGWLVLAGTFFLLFSDRLGGATGAMITGVVGIVVGMFMQPAEAGKHLPYLKSHLNPDSVERQLKELES